MRAAGAEPNAKLAPAANGRTTSLPVTRDAATVILVSDRPDLHVLMLERTRRAAFGPGATVFPGGAVDPADAVSAGDPPGGRVVGLDDPEASAEQGIDAGGLAFRVAAVRECFEEAGILLARDAATGERVEHDPPLHAARAELNAGAVLFDDVLAARGLVIDVRELRVFSHWLTPMGAPRRYNTWFFAAAAPSGEDGTHDDNELVASAWVRPAEALQQHAAGEIELILPTEMSLRALSRYASSHDLLRDLDAVPRHGSGGPAVVSEGTGERVVLPHDSAPTMQWTIPLPDISFRVEQRAARDMTKVADYRVTK